MTALSDRSFPVLPRRRAPSRGLRRSYPSWWRPAKTELTSPGYARSESWAYPTRRTAAGAGPTRRPGRAHGDDSDYNWRPAPRRRQAAGYRDWAGMGNRKPAGHSVTCRLGCAPASRPARYAARQRPRSGAGAPASPSRSARRLSGSRPTRSLLSGHGDLACSEAGPGARRVAVTPDPGVAPVTEAWLSPSGWPTGKTPSPSRMVPPARAGPIIGAAPSRCAGAAPLKFKILT